LSFVNIHFNVYFTLVASFIALRPIVIVDLLGIQKLTDAFGLTSLFQGIACLIGTPLSGNWIQSIAMQTDRNLSIIFWWPVSQCLVCLVVRCGLFIQLYTAMPLLHCVISLIGLVFRWDQRLHYTHECTCPLLFVIILLKQKVVMQKRRLADVQPRHFGESALLSPKFSIIIINKPMTNQTRGQSNLTKSASRGANSPVRGRNKKVILGGRNLYHWIPGVGVPISVP